MPSSRSHRSRPKANARPRDPRPLVSVCMIGRDEERFLTRALASIEGLADEIVFVDTGSRDQSISVARSFGARVYEIEWPNDFSKARNYGIDRARGRWIVVLDCDEEFPPQQAAMLRRTIESLPAGVVAIQISQANVTGMDDRRLLDSGRTIRAFTNVPQHRYSGPIHEQIGGTLTDGRLLNSAFYVWHYGFLQEVVADKSKIERNYRMLQEFITTLAEDSTYYYYVQMQLGRECQRMLKPQEADAHFARAVDAMRRFQQDPSTPHYPFFEALSAYYMENLLALEKRAEAIAFANEQLAHFPWHAELWFFLGYAELLSGDLAIGITHLLFATAIADVRRTEQEFYSPSRSILAYYNAAIALANMHVPEAALQILLFALTAAPEDPRLLGFTRQLLTDNPVLRAVLAQVGKDEVVHSVLKFLTVRQDAALIEDIVRPRAAKDPQSRPMRFWQGSQAIHAGDLEGAIDLLRGVDLSDEVGVFAQLGRIAALARLGRVAELQDFLREAPQDLFHSLQREISGLPLGDLPERYPHYRSSFLPMLAYWQVPMGGIGA